MRGESYFPSLMVSIMLISVCMDSIGISDYDQCGISEAEIDNSVYSEALMKTLANIMEMYEGNTKIQSDAGEIDEAFKKVRYAGDTFVSYVNKDKSSGIYTFISDIRAARISPSKQIQILDYPPNSLTKSTKKEMSDKVKALYNSYMNESESDEDIIGDLIILLNIAFWAKKDPAIGIFRYDKNSDKVDFF